MNKIAIIGVTASGKTTIANKIGKILDIPVHHLDKTFWAEKGGLKQDAFVEKVNEILKESKWIMDGSFPRSRTLEIRIENADTIILYDLPLPLVLWRQTKRYFKYRNQVRPDMGGNNIQKYPFTWKEVKWAYNFPIKEIKSKITPLTGTKNIIIIKSPKDEIAFIKSISF